MKRYGQFCPVAKAAEVFCERWTPLILRDLALGATRFAELQRGVPLASPTLLSHRLKQLEEEGIVERRKSASGRSWTYHLTPAGEDFAPIVFALGRGDKRGRAGSWLSMRSTLGCCCGRSSAVPSRRHSSAIETWCNYRSPTRSRRSATGGS